MFKHLSAIATALTSLALNAQTTNPLTDMQDELFTDRIYSHEPIYIVGGGRPEFDLKYQLSFKVQLARRVFLGYSQLNHWDVKQASSPFRDTTHRPSLFWYGPNPNPPPQSNPDLKRLSFHMAAGYEHKSNGRDGAESRSADTLFLRGTGYYGHPDDSHGKASIKLFGYVAKGSKNQDIGQYRNYAEFEVMSLHENSLGIGFAHAYGPHGRGSSQVDLTYAFKRTGFRWLECVPGFLYFQVFHGYG